MSNESKKYLQDIINSIELIDSFISDTPDFSAYQHDKKTKSAVERQLEIIGEAINKYKKFDGVTELTNAKQIINFRNRLAHSYDNIDDSIVWLIVIRHLKTLKFEINNILS